MKRFLFILIFSAVTFACDTGKRNPVPIIPDNSTGECHTVFLFEIEGIRVYRFYDHGKYHYLAIGPNVRTVQTVQSQIRSIGKTAATEYWDDSVIYIDLDGDK